ncbi:P27 family phage terminase small subunit [Marinilabilia salmonicolor]|uniref:P27 family predicted phage terminase small subunit n=1 Tax=Marinilabilia salmonicolor TaxID=989 RepID=A0A368VC20_9BACT|nr:P27 family phage terminase small subunit [Marinilabilia salmonicolor]RCW38672.1 P27 family predicted phage terminase small subunit [Marinilabilia salmonicolor]
MTKKQLIEYIKTKGLYEDVDLVMIDELLYNIRIAKQSKADLKKYGLMMNVSKNDEKPYFQQSPAVNIYNSSIKNIMNLSRKLALSPLDRQNLKVTVEDEDDGFD